MENKEKINGRKEKKEKVQFCNNVGECYLMNMILKCKIIDIPKNK